MSRDVHDVTCRKLRDENAATERRACRDAERAGSVVHADESSRLPRREQVDQLVQRSEETVEAERPRDGDVGVRRRRALRPSHRRRHIRYRTPERRDDRTGAR